MGHARYDELRDLEDIFAVIRALPGISEPTAGTFYLRRKPFLHFHTKNGARWADAKAGASWGAEIPIPLHCAPRVPAPRQGSCRPRRRPQSTPSKPRSCVRSQLTSGSQSLRRW